jgi:CSLREA domain-containing protein
MFRRDQGSRRVGAFRRAVGLRTMPARVRIRVLASVTLIALLLGALPVDAATPSLRLQAPARVSLGKSITLTLSVQGISGMGGYETQLLFDRARADVVRFIEPGGLRRIWGRDARRLGPVELENGLAFGAYSCAASCVTAKGAKKHAGRSGNVAIVTVELRANRAGPLEIALGETKLVDALGRPLAIRLPPQRFVTVQVGAAGGARARAPAGRWTLRPSRAERTPKRDVNKDGAIRPTDAAEATLAWIETRELQNACAVDAANAADVNGDGCVDVGDVQQVASALTTAPAAVTQEPMVFRVDSIADADDANAPAGPGDGTCATSTGQCTLRAAIREANWHAGPDRIEFNIAGTGTHTIQLGSALPALDDTTGGTTIDGYTQPGSAPNTHALISNAAIRIELRGPFEFVADPAPDASLQFSALTLVSPGNVIRGLALYRFRRKIWMSGANATENVIVGNFVGTDAAGLYGAPARYLPAYGGVQLSEGASRNAIGRPGLADRNVISGNAAWGLDAASLNNENKVQNNIFGLSPDGTRRLVNYIHAVDFNYGSSRNEIGGELANERNVLAGSDRGGIEVSHGTDTNANRIVGNLIGLDPAGRATSYSYNSFVGVHVEDFVSDTVVANNVVGNNLDGAIWLDYHPTGTRVYGNRLGIAMDNAAIPNGNSGVRASTGSTGSTIGPNNIIANNPAGIRIEGADSDGNAITRNSIFSNSGIGIELSPEGANPNDPSDTDNGANDQLNHPAIANAVPGLVTGRACTGCHVEVFRADGGANEYGPGRDFVGSGTADASGVFTATVGGLSVGQYVTATSTDGAGNTSEFSLNWPVLAGGTSGRLIAADAFARTTPSGWGTANSGGSYWVTGNPADYSVNGGVGVMAVPAPGIARNAVLSSLAVRDFDLSVRFRTDNTAADGNLSVFMVGRQISPGTKKRPR